MEFKVHKIELTKELCEHLEFTLVELTIPNLESYNVTRDSVLNFQTVLFDKVNNLFWDPSNSPIYIRINTNEIYYKYIIRVTNIYNLKNITLLESLVNSLFEKFIFKYVNKKRRLLSEEYISYKVQKMNI
jgi:hypothetical protein